jgi:hypothetical protein
MKPVHCCLCQGRGSYRVLTPIVRPVLHPMPVGRGVPTNTVREVEVVCSEHGLTKHDRELLSTAGIQ